MIFNGEYYFYRITSTYVENTGILTSNTQIGEDHLHIRGEYPETFGATTEV